MRAIRPIFGVLILAGLVVCGSLEGAESELPSKPPPSVQLQIVAQRGAQFSQAAFVYRGDVRVRESRMYMECELLTVELQTNSALTKAKVSLTNLSDRVRRIVAETNVLIMSSNMTIIGDRAVYYTSEQLITVSGPIIVIQFGASINTFTEEVMFDLRTEKIYSRGRVGTEIKREESGSADKFLRPRPGGAVKKPDQRREPE